MSAPTPPVEDENDRKPAAKLDLNLHRNFYAIRSDESLTAPAIFFSWEDCKRHLNSDSEYQRFDTPLRAMQYLSGYICQNEPKPPPAATHSGAIHAVAAAAAAASPLPEPRDVQLLANAVVAVLPAVAKHKTTQKQAKFDKKFKLNLERLIKYKETHDGNINVVGDDSHPEFKGLGMWVSKMRTQARKFQNNDPLSCLTGAQVQNLLDLQPTAKLPSTTTSKFTSIKFENNLGRLKEYVSQYGDDAVPDNQGYITEAAAAKFKGLGSWVKRTRKQCREFQKGAENLSMDQPMVDRLIAAGLAIEEKKPGRLKRTQNNDKKSPKKPFKPEQMFRDDPTWDERFAELAAFSLEHGHTTVPQRPKSQLYNYTQRMRFDYERFKEGAPSTLNGERIVQLTEIDFQFTTVKRKSWNERALEWLDYFTKHARSPPRDMEGGLGQWVGKMRRMYRFMNDGQPHPSLTREQADRLTGWGFIWDSPMPQLTTSPTGPRLRWEERYEELLQYKAHHGDCLVPQSYPGLGQWTKRMRKQYQKLKKEGKSRLKEEQIDLLFDAGFVFQLRESRRYSHHDSD